MENTISREGLEIEIENLELIIGTNLPDKYRKFLKKYDGLELSYNSLPLERRKNKMTILFLKTQALQRFEKENL